MSTTTSNPGLTTPGSEAGEVVLTRILDAPRELVFKVWTEPRHLQQWWGPHEFTVPHCEFEARPGGSFRIDMQAPDGTILPGPGVVQEFVEPERLVLISRWVDDEGNILLEGLNTITFAEQGGKTKLTLVARLTKVAPEAAGSAAGMEEGWSQSLERLGAYVATL